MTRLIVSVRSAEEALAALEGGADLIDVKEPNSGSLGRAATEVLEEIADAVAGRLPLSAALGELGEAIDAATIGALRHYAYAKIGLAGATNDPSWQSTWGSLNQSLSQDVRPVAVVYADGQQCAAPDVDEVLAVSLELACGAILVDTFHKDGRNLFDHWSTAEVTRVVHFARQNGLLSVLAGALQLPSIRLATTLSPDFVAVRSAVCEGTRTGAIRTNLVDEMSRELRRLPV